MKKFAFICLVLFFSISGYSQKIISKDKYIRLALKEDILRAKQGDPESQYLVGMHCIKGSFLKKDLNLGLSYLKKASQSQYAKASEKMGDYSEDIEMAQKYYELAICQFVPTDKFPVDINILKLKIDALPFGGFEKDSYDRFSAVENCYLSGEFELCSDKGDSLLFSLDKCENIYDAMTLAYSAMANKKLMFSQRRINDEYNYTGNLSRMEAKADMALSFLLGLKISDERLKNDSQYVSFLLTAIQASLECLNIMDANSYRILESVHNKILPLIDTELLKKHEKLFILYCEVLFLVRNEDFASVTKVIDRYVSIVNDSNNETENEKADISSQFFLFSDLINSLESQSDEMTELAVMTTINAAEYSYKILKRNVPPTFIDNIDDIRNVIKEDEIALIIYTGTNGLDSWIYAWMVEKGNSNISSIYCGHSYWSEEQAIDEYTDERLAEYNKVWLIGTMDMSFVDYVNNPRYVRVKSYTDINSVKSVDIQDVTVVGDVNYNISSSDIIVDGLEHSKEELTALSKLFKDKYHEVRGNNFTKSTIEQCESSILHISTHGIFDKKLLSKLNEQNPYDGKNGMNIMRSCGLMLSGYNDNPENNFLTAEQIMRMDLSKISIVFLNTCESASGKHLPSGDFSLLDAFYIAGVKKIIAFLDNVQDNVAARFSNVLYSKLKEGCDFHTAFYSAKEQVCPYNRIVFYE